MGMDERAAEGQAGAQANSPLRTRFSARPHTVASQQRLSIRSGPACLTDAGAEAPTPNSGLRVSDPTLPNSLGTQTTKARRPAATHTALSTTRTCLFARGYLFQPPL